MVVSDQGIFSKVKERLIVLLGFDSDLLVVVCSCGEARLLLDEIHEVF
jgi:hypothetical protein